MTVARNDITGDPLKTKVASNAFRDNFDRIFGKKSNEEQKEDVKNTLDADLVDAYQKTISE